jgi:geranylgeranyl diphosphate synthase type I
VIAERHRTLILDGLADALAGESRLRAILRYHVGLSDADGNPTRSTGKLLRPLVVVATAEGLGKDAAVALDAGVALELVHNFSLIHDDIQDHDEVRRGRPTVWALHGVAEAINAGDLMLTIAMSRAIAAGESVAATLACAADRMIEGQSLDLQFESRTAAPDEYLGMVDRKTGALLSCAFELGGIVAEASEQELESLVELGRSIGRAFQIQDDLLGIWGDGDVVGKPQGSDIRRRKKSFPIAVAHAEAEGDDLERLKTIYAESEEDMPSDDVDWVVDLLEHLGVRARGEEAVSSNLGAARALLDALPFDPATANDMRALLERLAGREK